MQLAFKVDDKLMTVCDLVVVSIAGMGHSHSRGESPYQQHVDS